MLLTEEITVDGRILVKTYSDQRMQIERDGVRYAEAIDPPEAGRTYVETEDPIDSAEISDAEALRIITGGEE